MKYNTYIDKEEEFDMPCDTDYMKSNQMTMEEWTLRKLKRFNAKYLELKTMVSQGSDDEAAIVMLKIGILKGMLYTLDELASFLYEGQQWEKEHIAKKARNLLKRVIFLQKRIKHVVGLPALRKNSDSQEFSNDVIENIAELTSFDSSSIKELVEEILEEKKESWTSLMNKPLTVQQASDFFMRVWHKE